MNYTYSFIINGNEIIPSTTLQNGITYFYLSLQVMRDSSIMLLNNETCEVIMEYIPYEGSLGQLFISSSIEEV